MRFLKKLLIALPLVAMLAGCGCNNKSGGDEDVEVDETDVELDESDEENT